MGICKRLLAACPRLLNEVDGDGDTPLHCAARGGHTEVVAELITLGADASLQNFSEEVKPHAPAEPGRGGPRHRSCVEPRLVRRRRCSWWSLATCRCARCSGMCPTTLTDDRD